MERRLAGCVGGFKSRRRHNASLKMMLLPCDSALHDRPEAWDMQGPGQGRKLTLGLFAVLLLFLSTLLLDLAEAVEPLG